MARKPAPVTQTELAILEVLWNKQPRNVREIVDQLYSRQTRALYATVKSLLERLEAKGYVACDKSSFAHQFSARITRAHYVGHQLEALAESHFGGSVAPMLLTLVESIKLSRKDRAAIIKIIEGLE
jgi:BlaI family transcriptional regulator, penicillinase repressor